MFRKLVSSSLVITLAVLLGATNAFAVKPPPSTNQAPVVTAFDVASESASPVPVSTFTATDADGTIAGYLITETSAKPSAGASGWIATKPTLYTTSSVGTVVLYGWVKDDKDAVSDSRSDTVIIPQPPINADTLDWKDSTEFAAAVHNHDGRYQQQYANVVVVAKSGGDFTDPVTALQSITDSSVTNPYLVKVMPGVYNVGSSPVQLKPFVTLEGAGRSATQILATSKAVLGAANSVVRGLTLQVTGAYPDYAFGIDAYTGVDMRIADMDIVVSGGSYSFGIYGSVERLYIDDVSIWSDGVDLSVGIRDEGHTQPWQVTHVNIVTTGVPPSVGYSYDCRGGNAVISDLISTAYRGSALLAYGGTVSCTDCVLTGDGTSDAVSMVGSPIVSITDSYLKGSTGILNASASGVLTVRGSVIEAANTSLYNANAAYTNIANTQIIGTIHGTARCFGVYDGSYEPLACQ